MVQGSLYLIDRRIGRELTYVELILTCGTLIFWALVVAYFAITYF